MSEANDKVNEYLKKVARTIDSVRYGNLSARLEDVESPYPAYKDVTDSINRMIETLGDREKMIAEYQSELVRQIDNEREIKKLKEDFVAALTHDLKVPIIAQANVVDFLLDGKFGELNEKQRTALKNMQASNKELIGLVQMLLETYKVQEQGIKLSKEKIDLNKFIEKIVDEMQPAGVNIKFVPDKNVTVANADPVQLERAIKNILSNAILHSGSKNIDVKTAKKGKFITISIIDYGQGISPSDIKKVFDKYYCAKKTGTGLGLYLAQQIARAHEGEITVESKKNVRTEFCIKLPGKS
jgi:signal transduction histidine kinase